jgi:hypothetical protein
MCSMSSHYRMIHTSIINQQIRVTIRKAIKNQMQTQVVLSYFCTSILYWFYSCYINP